MAADVWYDDSNLVRLFAEALTNADVLTEPSDFIDFNKKPMKYNDEYEAWAENGFPTSEDDDNWDEFTEAVSSDETDDSDGDSES